MNDGNIDLSCSIQIQHSNNNVFNAKMVNKEELQVWEALLLVINFVSRGGSLFVQSTLYTSIALSVKSRINIKVELSPIRPSTFEENAIIFFLFRILRKPYCPEGSEGMLFLIRLFI